MPRKGTKLFPVNLLKEWQESEADALYGAEPDWDEEGASEDRGAQEAYRYQPGKSNKLTR